MADEVEKSKKAIEHIKKFKQLEGHPIGKQLIKYGYQAQEASQKIDRAKFYAKNIIPNRLKKGQLGLAARAASNMSKDFITGALEKRAARKGVKALEQSWTKTATATSTKSTKALSSGTVAKTATKVAGKVAGKVASKIVAPIGTAMAVYDIGKAGVEGYKAYKAYKELKGLEEKMKQKTNKRGLGLGSGL